LSYRHLPTFPTRRSSDLRHHETERAIELLALRLHALFLTQPVGDILLMHRTLCMTQQLEGEILVGRLARAAGARCLGRPAKTTRDRKSTRLNSSHVAISY